MGQLLIRNVDDHVIDTLKRRAKAANSSLEAEARIAIAKGAELSREEKAAVIDRWLEEGERLKVPGVEQTPGWVLIREDRDRR
jgi:plasmid stability protein